MNPTGVGGLGQVGAVGDLDAATGESDAERGADLAARRRDRRRETTLSFARVAAGGCPPAAPTDPDVQNSRIRLFGTRIRYAGE